MRLLFSTTRGTGHFLPLVPIIEAARAAGHDVLVAGPPDVEGPIGEHGYDYWRLDPPPEGPLGEVWDRVPTAPDPNAVVIGEIFGHLNTAAALPRMQEAIAEWRPDVIVRETSEYSSALAGERAGVPVARIAIAQLGLEDDSFGFAQPALDELRADLGLDPDPGSEIMRSSLFLTPFPASLEGPEGPVQPKTVRFSDPAWTEAAPTGETPFVYMTFGTVAGGTPFAAAAFAAALEAAGGLPIEALLTVGKGSDPASLGEPPPNVRVERWVPQSEALGRASAIVCHGGAGSTLGALAAGAPLIVVPLFADQPQNAAAVTAAGAGLTAPPEAAQIRAALERVLGDESFRAAAGRLSDELRAQPPTGAAIDYLEKLTSPLE